MPQDKMAQDASGILRTAARVLDIESTAIACMRDNLPADLAPAVRCILASRGRVIVSGIGKSGHIGRKLAATLASTGTTAYFVHASEASHGDLGMITKDDVCILISNSGETRELSDLITYTRRFNIPLIGISSISDSTLMRQADLRLLLPGAPEACAIGMAPTTSTTLTLALGDALAVALMEQRAFKPEEFRNNHPGGKLGLQLAQVRQLMHETSALAAVAPDLPMTEVLIQMSEAGFGIACVVADGKVAGVISDGDLRRHIDRITDLTACEVATSNPKTVGPEMMAAQALGLMNESKINALIVVDADNAPIGLLRIHDCLKAGLV
ncbi:KpsF/GutQ family sugar-phosphate isomerase [Parasedimentitalea marina]|nr:KpsF/GutQ family sugar-phosphate isomerase [Parasedimentitalea marina]